MGFFSSIGKQSFSGGSGIINAIGLTNPVTAPFAIANIATGSKVTRTLLGEDKPTPMDPSAELARIRALYGERRAALVSEIRGETARRRSQAAANLATRGILRAPVSEATFGEVRRVGMEAESKALGELAGQQAGVEAQLMAQYAQMNMQREMQARAERNQLIAALIGGGASIASGFLTAPAAAAPAAPAAPAAVGAGGAHFSAGSLAGALAPITSFAATPSYNFDAAARPTAINPLFGSGNSFAIRDALLPISPQRPLLPRVRRHWDGYNWQSPTGSSGRFG